MAIKSCLVCEQNFGSSFKNAKFCSRKCANENWRKIHEENQTKVCAQCDTSFMSSHRNARFCSGTCRGLSQQHPLRGPKLAFQNQRHAAKVRNIAWAITFEEWWEVWQSSGKYAERGRGHGKYQMSRVGDVGPYSVENVRIITSDANLAEREAMPGELNGMAKLTEDDVLAIRAAEGVLSRTEVATHFGINYWHVRDIQKRHVWKHIKEN